MKFESAGEKIKKREELPVSPVPPVIPRVVSWSPIYDLHFYRAEFNFYVLLNWLFKSQLREADH